MHITLTTDFGDAGPFVGVMKAVIRRYAPAAEIADLTHRVAPCVPAEAGFWLSRSYRYFPAGSVHVAVVDPGVGTARAILACAWDGHLFLAPDNGILPMIAPPGTPMHRLSDAWAARQDWPRPSRTFHGRDIFAPLAAMLASGKVLPADIGPACEPLPPAAPAAVRNADGTLSGCVVAIDTWGNLISNIDAALIRALPAPSITIAGHSLRLADTYGSAQPGNLLALVNSFDVLEIACRDGHAAQRLGVRHGERINVSGGG